MFFLRKPLTRLLLASVAITSASVAFAEDKPEVYFRAATIIDRWNAVAKESGFTMPPIADIIQHVENEYPFFGNGSIVPSRPVGVTGYLIKFEPDATLAAMLHQSVAFIVPVTADSAPMDSLQIYAKSFDQDAVTKDKTVSGKNIGLKRLPNHIAWSEGPGALHVPDDPFADDFKKPSVLGVASLDLGLLRKKAPQIEEQLVEMINKEARDESAVPVVISVVRQIVDSLDTINVVATHADDVLTYTATVDPVAIKTAAAFPRPAFVEGQFVELHIVWPNEKFSKWIPSAIEKFDTSKFTIPGILDDETAAATKQCAARAAKLFLGDGAVSLGVHLIPRVAKDEKIEPHGHAMGGPNVVPEFQSVTQFASDVDVAKEVSEIAATVKSLAKKQKLPTPIDVSEYNAGKQKVIRVTILRQDEPVYYIDLAQSGRRLAATFSHKKLEGKAATLLALAGKEKSSDFVQVTLDIVPLLKATMGQFVPPAAFDKMKTGIGDVRYSVTAKSDDAGKSMVVEIKQPLVIAREMEKAMKESFGRFNGGEVEIPESIEPMQPLDIRE